MGAGKRAVRVGDQMMRTISAILIEKVRDPRVREVTLTGIKLSTDLQSAKVYYSVLAAGERIREAQQGLDSAKGYIKREMGLRMSLKYMPRITFIYDGSLERGSQLEKVFAQIRPLGEKEPL